MRGFVTGATGFVGSAIVPELIGAGHQVLGLARSDAAASSLTAAGADVQRGSLDDLESLRNGASAADVVIRAGFIHDFANYAAAAEIDRCAIETIGAVPADSERPFIVTSGIALAALGRVAREAAVANSNFPRKSEEAVASAAAGGARVGGAPSSFSSRRRRSWIRPAAARYHAVADEGVAFREIAEVIGRPLNVPIVSKSPEEATDHFGWFAHFAGLDCPASSARTKEQLGWRPMKASLIPNIDQPGYFETNQKTFDQRGGASK
jgi:nucleoside-diphosphate-sugar epimerase